jgi:hypothetical protein
MPSKRYTFSGSTADGSVEFDAMRFHHINGLVSITFYSDADLTSIVTPTEGTVTVTVSEDGVIFGTVPNGTLIDAAKIGPNTEYSRPNWIGSARSIKLTFANIAGAGYFKCRVIRSGGD